MSNSAASAHFASTPHQCEYRMRIKNGEWRWMLGRGKVTARDAQGQPLRIAGTHTDIADAAGWKAARCYCGVVV